ncbi:MAG: hypothetical protein ACK55Z_16725, partial [bacterium]
SILVDPRFVHAIGPTLVEVDQKYQVVSEDRETMQRGHFDYKGKQVIDDCVQELVHHCTPGQVGNALELVVDKELGCHHDKAEGVDTSHRRPQQP